MVSRSEGPGRPRRRGVLRHYHRPLRADRVFLLVLGFSLVATVAFVGVVLVVTGVPTRAVDWLRPALVGVLVFLLSFRLLGMGVTTSRSFSEGLTERSSASRAADPGGAETTGRAAGAVVGRALRSTRRAPGPTHAGEGSGRAEGRRAAEGPTAPPPAAPAAATAGTRSETDRAARAAGAVVGRRLAERRRRREGR